MNIQFPDSFKTVPTSMQHLANDFAHRSRRTKLIVAGLGLLVLLLVWHIVAQLISSKPKQIPLPPVHIGIAHAADVDVLERTIGSVLAESTVQVTAQVQGQLLAANFREGQIVRRGDLLFQIDPKPFQAALEQAQAALAKDQASLVSAENDERRFVALFNQNAASAQQRDQAIATAKGFEASVASDKAAIDVARINLGYTTIRSPIDGKTGPILIQPGNLVAANGPNPLVTITQIQPIKVSFFLPQSDLPQIQSQMQNGKLKAIVTMQDAPGNREIAPVNFVSNAVSAQTGTIELRATFPNQDMRLVPGQMVDVAVTMKQLPHAIVVPRNAVNVGPDRNFVYVVNAQQKVEQRTVRVLYDDGTNDAIEGRVKPGDRLVTEGQLRLGPGSAVQILTSPATTAAPVSPGAQ